VQLLPLLLLLLVWPEEVLRVTLLPLPLVPLVLLVLVLLLLLLLH
jgi:hypothetical protein